MKYITLAFLAVWSLSAVAEKPQSVEIRFCPASSVRTYSLESRRDLQSLLVQNVAVINHGEAPFQIDNIDIELLQANRVVESRKLDREAAQRTADRGAKLQAAGVLQKVGFQFCGTDLIEPDIKLGGPILDRNRALLIVEQVFAFGGPCDTLRVRVHGSIGGHARQFTGSIPIKSEFAQNKYIFPLRGVWYVGWELPFTRVIAGPFRKSSLSTLRRSVRLDSATKVTEHVSMIITLTVQMCSPRQMAL